MSHVVSIALIEASAKAALEASVHAGRKPVNPFVPGTEQHKEWTMQFYRAQGIPARPRLQIVGA